MKTKNIIASLLVLGATSVGVTSVLSAQSLNGAGSTFVNPILTKWFSEYHAAHPEVTINYQGIGSGGGIRQVTAGTVDFGATDGPMTDAQLAEAKKAGHDLLHIPTVLGAVVPVYNLPGLKFPLKFSGDVLADIYLGKITVWNDPRIVKDNPNAGLPATNILVVHRSDGSGTSYIFTDYLSKVNKAWESGPGRNTAVQWPLGIGGNHNEGVAGVVRQNVGAIGYVELIYAVQNKIEYGLVKSASGQWVQASIQSVTNAAAGAKVPADFRVSITNAPGNEAYPISSFTWLLIPTHSADPAKGKVLVDFVNWMIDHGESEVSTLAYAPLPDAVAANVKKAITQVH
jgi:phosphate transport system substrate-binding protein